MGVATQPSCSQRSQLTKGQRKDIKEKRPLPFDNPPQTTSEARCLNKNGRQDEMKYTEAREKYYEKAYKASRFASFAESEDASHLTDKEIDLLFFIADGCKETGRTKPTFDELGKFLYSATQILKQDEELSLDVLAECLVIALENKKVDDEGVYRYAVGVMKKKAGM